MAQAILSLNFHNFFGNVNHLQKYNLQIKSTEISVTKYYLITGSKIPNSKMSCDTGCFWCECTQACSAVINIFDLNKQGCVCAKNFETYLFCKNCQ